MAIGRLDVDLGLNTAEFTEGLSRAEQQGKKFQASLDKLVSSLTTQVATLGYSERQVKIYELALKGATKEQLLQVNALYKQKEAFAAADKAVAAAAAAAAKQKASSDAIDKQVKALHDQVAVQGKSERAAKLYALEQEGATKAQLKSADAALRQKAAYEATTRFMGDLKVAAIAAGVALTAAAVGAAVLFEKLVGKAASFQDLAEKTGASAEALASFQVAASVTNTSMDTLANLSVKLTKGLAGTDEETKQAANAIHQLGINVNDFKKLDPAAQFELIGKRLNEFADGSGKTAFAVAALGKAGAEALPFLKELGSQGQRNVILTAAQIKAADDYKDAQARLRAEVELYATRLAVTALPAVQDFQKALFETAKQILGVSTEAAKLAGNNDVAEFANKAARGLGVLVDAADVVIRGFQVVGISIASIAAQATALLERNLAGIRLIKEQSSKEIQAIIDRPLFSSNLAAQQATSARERELADDPERRRLLGTVAAFKPKKELDPRNFGGGGGANKAADEAARIAKKQLDEQLSQLDNFIKREDRLLEERNHVLDRLYDQDRLSIQDYFAAKIKALDDATFETGDIYREQIDDLKKFVSETQDETLKLQALKELGRKTEQQADFLSDSSRKATKLRDDAEKSLAAYGARVEEVRLKVLELAGAEATAAQVAAARFDASNADLLREANRQPGGEEVKRNLALLRQRAIDQTEVNSLLEQSRVIQQNLGTEEGRLALERGLGLRSELDTYTELGKARSGSVAQLQAMADKFSAMAEKFKDPAMIAQAKAFQLSIDELAASVDVLGNRIRGEFKESFSNAFEGLLGDLQDGKNALDSFKDFFRNFTNDIVRNINRLATQSIADALFKGASGGSSGGIGTQFADFFANLFRGNSGGGGGSASAGYFAELFMAGGTDFLPYDALVYAHRGERIVPAHENTRGGNGMTIQNTFVLPPGGYTRATQDQMASDAGRAINRANRRLA